MNKFIQTQEEFEEAVKDITQILKIAIEKHIPLLEHNDKLPNGKIAEIKTRNKYRRQHQRHPTNNNKQRLMQQVWHTQTAFSVSIICIKIIFTAISIHIHTLTFIYAGFHSSRLRLIRSFSHFRLHTASADYRIPIDTPAFEKN